MSLNNAIIYPANKVVTYPKNKSLKNYNSNIINLIFPGCKEDSFVFKLNERILPKLFLTKKGYSLKNINIRDKIPSIKDKDSQHNTVKKIIIKSNSENKDYFSKINFKKKKSNSFYAKINNKYIHNGSLNENNLKNENISKLKINIKNSNSFRTSRNLSFSGNPDELINANNISNNNFSLNKQNIKLKANKPYLVKTKSNFIPKFKSKINLSLYVSQNQQKKINNTSDKSKLIENKIKEKNNTFGNISTNIKDKENINSMNIINLNESNDNENLLFSRAKKFQKRKINLPFSPTSNKDQFFQQIKLKKFYIRNNKNELNIPYNKKTKLTRQYSYYNLNLIKYQNQRNKKINNTAREEGVSLSEMDIYKKNINSMSSYELAHKINSNSYCYDNAELSIVSKENNIGYSANNEDYGVEMNHFRIVKIIQENKNLLIKSEKNI